LFLRGLQPRPRGGTGVAGGQEVVVHGVIFSRRMASRKERPRGPGAIVPQ
jgi:hypothetical protein